MKLRPSYPLMAPAGDGDGGAAVLDRGDEVTAEQLAAAAAKPAAKTDPEPELPPKAEADPEPAPAGKPKIIPLERHQAILDAERLRREALEREVAQFRQGAQVRETGQEITALEEKIVKAEEEYNKLIADGELAKAQAKMREIRMTEREVTTRQAEQRAVVVEARAIEQARYDLTVERLEAQFPMLDPTNPNFDKDKTSEVLDLKESFVARGYTPSKALQRAVGYVFPASTQAQTKALTVEARPDPEAVAAARRSEAAAKTADAVGRTPPSLNDVGANSDKRGGGAITAKDVMKMSYDQFSKLNEETLAELRGDRA